MSENLIAVDPKLRLITDNECIDAKGERIKAFAIDGVYRIFLNLAEEVYKDDIKSLQYEERLEKVYELFNEAIFRLNDKRKIFIPKKRRIIDPNLLSGLFLNDNDNNSAIEYAEKLNEAYRAMTNQKNREKSSRYFRKEDMEKYLVEYLKLSHFLLSEKCVNQEELRSLNIIEDLLNIDLSPNKDFFGLYSPFIVYALMRALNYITSLSDFEQDTKFSTFESMDTRKHITATIAIRSLSRFTIINGKSYIVEYSRITNQMICKEVDRISSIDNIKPIRLFEKITSHIYDTFKENENKKTESFDIAIYGFCANKENAGSRIVKPKFSLCEVEDLIYEVFSWFEDCVNNGDSVLKDKHIEELNITYYNTSKTDKNSKWKDNQYKYTYRADGSETECICNLKIAVEPYRNFNNSHLKETLNNNSLVFLLDCPWLTTEKFTLINEGSIQSYANWIKTTKLKEDIYKPVTLYSETENFFNKFNVFNSLNDQFNRLAVSSMANYGKVVRVFKDYVLNCIQESINKGENNDKQKVVYVYNSSLRGISYSEYANYPIVREESYSGKRFSIMRFSSRENGKMEIETDSKKGETVEGNEGKIYVSLWSLLKYVDISFAYTGMKDYLAEHFKHCVKSNISSDETLPEEMATVFLRRDFISICRNIIFEIKYSFPDEKKQLNICVKLILTNTIKNKMNKTDETKRLMKFFQNIIKDVIFYSSNRLGDNYIREAFERCIYNQSRDINDIFFCHVYSKLRALGQLNSEKCKVSLKHNVTFGCKSDDVQKFSMFKDKRAYQKLFELLDVPQCSEFAIYSILNEIDKAFEKSDKHSKIVLQNIHQICEMYHYTDSYLYKNLKKIEKREGI